jgi:UDP-glucose 4-epimerase
MQVKKAVITGATGMVGATLSRYLLQQGTEVLCIVRPNSRKRGQLPSHPGLSVVEADLKDLKEAAKKITGTYDALFHLGWDGAFGDARNNMYIQNRNIEYTLNAVELAHALGCRVFVGAGSQAEYGRVSGEVKLSPDTPAFPENGYGMAKLCAGQMSRVMCRSYGIRHEWVRILSIYGPYDIPGTMVMSGIYSLLNGERPQYTKGEQMWDYLYSEDAVRALALVAEKGKDGSVYCIGSGQVRPLAEYIRRIRDAVDPAAEVGIGERPYMDKQVMYLCADISNLTKDTGFVPEIPFEEGIRRTVEWCRKRKNEND